MRSIRKVLVIQPYGLGDALFITPFLRSLRLLPTVESVDLVLGSRTQSVFQNNPHVDRIFSIDKDKWRINKKEARKEMFFLWRSLRGQYDLLVDFSLRPEYAFYGQFFLRIPRRIGFDFKNRGLFLNRRLFLPEGFEGAHVIDFCCELGKFLGLEIEERFLEFYLSKEDREEASKLLVQKNFSPHRYLAVAPGGGESWGKGASFRRWPVSFFIEMISLLRGRIHFEGVLVLGSRGERVLGEEIERSASFPVLNVTGEVSLGVSGALLEKSALFLTNDSGLVHLAHALHVPLIALYGPVDPQVYGPYPSSPRAVVVEREELPCRPCYSRFRYNEACFDRECLDSLSPRYALEFLDRRNFWQVLCNENSSTFS